MKNKTLWISVILLVPLLIILPYLTDYAYPTLSSYSDLTITHVPNLIHIKNSLLHDMGVPLWSDNILSGYPFIANPLSSIWYPPAWLLVILPMPIGFNVLILLHLWFCGIGMYVFLRSTGAKEFAALLGGLVFELSPKIFAHYGIGHITFIFAISWTPWILWTVNRYHDPSLARKWSPLAGVILGMILLADIRWGFYAGVLWVSYWAYQEIVLNQILSGKDTYQKRVVAKSIFRKVGRLAGDFVTGLFVAAPLLLLLQQFTHLSTRNSMVASDQLILEMKPVQLLGFLIPDMAGYAEWVIYPGVFVVMLFLYVVLMKIEFRKNIFWIGIFFLTVLFSLGDHVPFLNVLYNIPGFNLLRVPTRFMVIAEFALAVIACNGMDHLMHLNLTRPSKDFYVFRIVMVAVTGFVLLLALGTWYVSKSFPVEFVWAAIFYFIFLVLIFTRLNNYINGLYWTILVIPLLVMDILTIGYTQYRFMSTGEVFSQGASAASFIKKQSGTFRIYSPSYSLPQQTAALYGLELADGIDPLQIKGYVNYMEQATGVPVTGYGVSVPPFETGSPEKDNKKYIPDLDLLGNLNVKYIVSAYQITLQGLDLQFHEPNLFIYENTKTLPRAWVQPPNSAISQSIMPVDKIDVGTNHVTVSASGPGLLILSEIYYPDWNAFVDGRSQEIMETGGLLRGIHLEAGVHNVVVQYKPQRMRIGLIITSLYFLFLILWYGINIYKNGHKI